MRVQRGIIAAVVAIIGGLIVVGQTPASAVPGYRVYGTGGAGLVVRGGPGTNFPQIGWLAEGTWVDIKCQTYGTSVGGSRIWDRLNSPIAGYVSDYYMSTPVYNGFSNPPIPTCNQHDLLQHETLHVRNTFIYDPGPGNGISHEMFASPGFVNHYGARGFDRNFMVWAPIETFNAGDASWRTCNTTTHGHQHGFCPVGETSVAIRDVIPDRVVTAKRWNGRFIGIYCGNNTPDGTSGPVPRVRGTKYLDRNANGRRDAGEPGLGGWTIDLHLHGNVVGTTTTDASGAYEFRLDANANHSLTGGTYEVRERGQDGYRQTAAPGAFTVPFGARDAVFGGKDFGNYRLPVISISDAEDVVEGTGQDSEAVFTVSLDQIVGKDIRVRARTEDGTATGGADYVPIDEVVTIPAEAQAVQLPVTVIGDTEVEDDETFDVVLTESVDAVIHVDYDRGTATILDDDREDMACRATGLRLLGTEYAISNDEGLPCAAGSSRLAEADTSDVVPGAVPVRLEMQAVTAETNRNYVVTDPTRDGDAVEASAAAARFLLTVAGTIIEADVIESDAISTCMGETAEFSGGSRIVGLTIDGTPLAADGPASVPLGPVGTLHLNHQLADDGDLTVRGLWLETSDGREIVVAESSVAASARSCRPARTPG